MFSEDIMERIYSDAEARKIPLISLFSIISVIEDAISEKISESEYKDIVNLVIFDKV